jgi:hypothetical protein
MASRAIEKGRTCRNMTAAGKIETNIEEVERSKNTYELEKKAMEREKKTGKRDSTGQ